MIEEDLFNSWLRSAEYEPSYAIRCLMRNAWVESARQFEEVLYKMCGDDPIIFKIGDYIKGDVNA